MNLATRPTLLLAAVFLATGCDQPAPTAPAPAPTADTEFEIGGVEQEDFGVKISFVADGLTRTLTLAKMMGELTMVVADGEGAQVAIGHLKDDVVYFTNQADMDTAVAPMVLGARWDGAVDGPARLLMDANFLAALDSATVGVEREWLDEFRFVYTDRDNAPEPECDAEGHCTQAQALGAASSASLSVGTSLSAWGCWDAPCCYARLCGGRERPPCYRYVNDGKCQRCVWPW